MKIPLCRSLHAKNTIAKLRDIKIFLLTNEDKVSDSEQEKTMADWVTGKVTKVQNWTDALFSLTV
ncbi:hypothetical protein MJI47_27045, partial [Salmonella enterica subsp. enterica serovar Kentucky]|nr:hypothetical protein [Salmonella enterica subsp. enterica serovar Kentucky]